MISINNLDVPRPCQEFVFANCFKRKIAKESGKPLPFAPANSTGVLASEETAKS